MPNNDTQMLQKQYMTIRVKEMTNITDAAGAIEIRGGIARTWLTFNHACLGCNKCLSAILTENETSAVGELAWFTVYT